MKYLFLSILFIGLISNVQAQDSSTIKKYEIGIGTGFLSQNLLNNDLVSPYFFTCKFIGKSDFAFRFGLGGYYSEEDNDNVLLSNPNELGLAVRVGWEKRYHLTKNWLVNAGGDLSFRLDQEKRSSSTRVTINSINQYGFGVVTGFQYYFNDRISISTESTLLFSFTQENEIIKRDLGTDITENSNTTRDIGFLLPTSIFLVVAF